jgi:hypothetical protein
MVPYEELADMLMLPLWKSRSNHFDLGVVNPCPKNVVVRLKRPGIVVAVA